MIDPSFVPVGYAGIFVVAFIASTLVPLSSDVFVVGMILMKFDPVWVFALATAGNFAGSVTNYFIGLYGQKFILSRWISISEKMQHQAEKIYRRWGAPILFFSWLPGIGDPLCVVPGIFKLPFGKFVIWVLLGKAFRYFVLIGATLWATGEAPFDKI